MQKNSKCSIHDAGTIFSLVAAKMNCTLIGLGHMKVVRSPLGNEPPLKIDRCRSIVLPLRLGKNPQGTGAAPLGYLPVPGESKNELGVSTTRATFARTRLDLHLHPKIVHAPSEPLHRHQESRALNAVRAADDTY